MLVGRSVYYGVKTVNKLIQDIYIINALFLLGSNKFSILGVIAMTSFAL